MRKLLFLTLFIGTQLFSSDSGLIDSKAPDFTLSNLQTGKNVSLHELKGKVVVVDFWATWCAPCRKTLPLLQNLYSKLSDNVKILAINIDDEIKNAQSFVKRFQLTLPVLYDPDHSVVEKFEVPEMPTVFIIDKKGVIRFTHIGYSEDYEQKLTTFINKLL